MSRSFEMGVEIREHDSEKKPHIKQGAKDKWPFEDRWSSGD